MAGYERFALILDSERAELGRAAMRLLELGIDVLYANDVDEAALLARQESERLGAVLIPSTLGSARLEQLVSRVCSQLAGGARTLVVVGLEPDPSVLAGLAAKGVHWCIWEPYEDRELRFVMTAAMSVAHAGERRKQIRIPTEIETAVFMGRYRKDVIVRDVSLGGAYFAAEEPFLEGSQLSVDIALPTGPLVGKAEVMTAKTADRPGRADVPNGMGVNFTRLSPGSDENLQTFVQGWLRRFQLDAPED